MKEKCSPPNGSSSVGWNLPPQTLRLRYETPAFAGDHMGESETLHPQPQGTGLLCRSTAPEGHAACRQCSALWDRSGPGPARVVRCPYVGFEGRSRGANNDRQAIHCSKWSLRRNAFFRSPVKLCLSSRFSLLNMLDEFCKVTDLTCI